MGINIMREDVLRPSRRFFIVPDSGMHPTQRHPVYLFRKVVVAFGLPSPECDGTRTISNGYFEDEGPFSVFAEDSLRLR